jgi:hypothetical protein
MRREIKAGSGRLGIVGLLGALLLPSCGQSARNEPSGAGTAGSPIENGGAPAAGGVVAVAGSTSQPDGGRGGTAATGGTGNTGGRGNTGGTTDAGGAGNAAGDSSGEGGEAGACTCPLGDDCNPVDAAPCFEPCGGEPFGVWKLEDACFADAVVDGPGGHCQQRLSATPGDSDLTLRILDGGDLDVRGTEEWTLGATTALACLGIESSNRCQDASWWLDGLLFSPSAETSCVASSCGACDCQGQANGYIGGGFYQWSRAGNQLTLGGVTTNYCVKGDVLWLGGRDADGVPKVSYMFKKHSCVGTPVPCAERSPTDCTKSDSCAVGHCFSTSGLDAYCPEITWEPDCVIAEGCEWASDGCTGTTFEACDYDTCDQELGCSWGEPKQRCAGTPSRCQDLDLAQCASAGCKVVGETCASITQCASLSLAACHSEPGCRLEW